ncbi:hypothetical protein ES703_55517 [subsurface metagenome]
MAKVTFKRIAKSLTGISTPFFGLSWNPPESDRAIVRKLIMFLEDRRVLYNPYNIETPMFVAQSLLEIRKELTDTLQKIGDNSDISPHLRAMRAASRKYLNETDDQKPRFHSRDFEVFAAFGELRAVFGIHIAQLCVKYGIGMEQELASILPMVDDKK